jgi:hypothetical protein
MQTSKAARIEQLPVELQVIILKNLTETPALYNLIRSSREYYQAYIGHEQPILFAVLCNEMGREALDDAFTTIRISLVPQNKSWLKEMDIILYEYEFRRNNPVSSRHSEIYLVRQSQDHRPNAKDCDGPNKGLLSFNSVSPSYFWREFTSRAPL